MKDDKNINEIKDLIEEWCLAVQMDKLGEENLPVCG